MNLWQDGSRQNNSFFSPFKSALIKLKLNSSWCGYLVFLLVYGGFLLGVNGNQYWLTDPPDLAQPDPLSHRLPIKKNSKIKNRDTNVDDLYSHLFPQMMPVKNARLGSQFGNRSDPFTRQLKHHAGQDFPAPWGTPIRAAAAGVVVRAGYHKSYGYMIDIDHGANLLTRYGHASKLLVDLGQIVQRGQRIALVGSTGRSTGPHLHFEVHWHGVPVNPLKFLQNELAVLNSKGGRSVNVRKNDAY